MSTVIGLSFGNTTSSIAYIKEGAVEVIANQDGDRAIPSMLSYAHEDEFHGQQAKLQIVRNATNTIGFFRDYVGVPFDKIDVSLAERTAQPVRGADGLVEFSVGGERKSVASIVERQFARLHDSARDFIGRDIDGVVLALPHGYPAAQRAALVEIAAKAGLPVRQVIGEASAALLAHLSREDVSSELDKLVVVADFGGSRADAALVSVNSGIYTVLATHHSAGLGGRLLDAAVLSHLASEFSNQFSVDPLADPRAVAKLWLEAELLRKTLSNSTNAQFGIDSVAGFDFSGSLNRLKFEVVARAVFQQFAAFVGELLSSAKTPALAVDEVLLVGGVAWSPKLAQVVGALFDERTKVVAPSTDSKALDPDELIARGCAIQASLIGGLDTDEVSAVDNHLQGTKLAKAVGVQIGDLVVPILGAHTLAPTKKTVLLSDLPQGASQVSIVEIESVVETTVHEPAPKAEAAPADEDDDESDWGDSEDEAYEVHTLVHKAVAKLAEIDLKVADSVKVTLYFTAAQKLQVVVASGDAHAQGTI